MNTSEYFEANKFGFSYPNDYEEFIQNQGEFGELRWWFLGSSQGLFNIAYELVNKDLESDIELFPFAKSSETNAISCFDREGKVYFVIGTSSLKNIDWSKRLTRPNIRSWYEGVIAGEF